MKKSFFIMIILLLCGCSAQYELTVDEDKILEKIVFPIEKSQIHEEDEIGLEMDIYSKDSIDNILLNDIYVEDNNKKYIYNKVISDENNQYIVTLTHEYDNNRFANSRLLNECFENTVIEETDYGLNIKLSGKFYCYVEDDESVDFTINTKNVVKGASAKHNMFTNKYAWKIDNSNRDEVDINIQILYQSKVKYYGLKTLVIAVGIVVAIGIIACAYKISKRSEVNGI